MSQLDPFMGLSTWCPGWKKAPSALVLMEGKAGSWSRKLLESIWDFLFSGVKVEIEEQEQSCSWIKMVPRVVLSGSSQGVHRAPWLAGVLRIDLQLASSRPRRADGVVSVRVQGLEKAAVPAWGRSGRGGELFPTQPFLLSKSSTDGKSPNHTAGGNLLYLAC